MPRSDRYYANIAVQTVSLSGVAAYAYVSAGALSESYAYLGLALVLFAFGYLRPVRDALIAAMIGALLYGGYIAASSMQQSLPLSPGWGDLFWLLALPAMALIGGLNRDSENVPSYALSFLDFGDSRSLREEGPCLVDDSLSYLSGTSFVYKLEEEVLGALRDRRKFRLVLVEIERFREFKRLAGTDQSRILLNFVAEACSRTNLTGSFTNGC